MHSVEMSRVENDEN